MRIACSRSISPSWTNVAETVTVPLRTFLNALEMKLMSIIKSQPRSVMIVSCAGTRRLRAV